MGPVQGCMCMFVCVCVRLISAASVVYSATVVCSNARMTDVYMPDCCYVVQDCHARTKRLVGMFLGCSYILG